MNVIEDPDNDGQYLIEDATESVFGAHLGPTVVSNVHPTSACMGERCVIHNPSDHHMRSWRLTWRDDKAVMERLCPHGIGHPDPDDAAYLTRNGREAWTVHGCDGCCAAEAHDG